LVYSLILPSSWSGVGAEEYGQSWWCVTILLQTNRVQSKFEQKNGCSEQSGVVKEEMSSLFTTRGESRLN